LLGAREDDFAVPFLLQTLNLVEASKELAVIQTVYVDNL